jgi:NitT/TauT family transport system substrate-binding protein
LNHPRGIALVRGGAALTAVACGLCARGAFAQSAAIHVVASPFDGAAEPFYATDLGFFRKAGLDAEITTTNSGPATMAAVASGTLEFGAANLASLAIAHERGLPLVMIAASGTYDASATQKTAALLVANHSASTAVNFIELPFSQMDAALAAGRIDAAITEEPALSSALAQNSRVLGYAYDAIAKRFVIGAWFVTKDYASAHPEIVRRFTDAIATTAQWANRHHPDSAKILEKYSKIAVPPDMARTIYAEHLRAAEVQPLIDAAAKYGVLKNAFPASDMIAPGIAT